MLGEDRIEVLVLGTRKVDPGPVFLRAMPGLPNFYGISYLYPDATGTHPRFGLACASHLADAGYDNLLAAARLKHAGLVAFAHYLLYTRRDVAAALPVLRLALKTAEEDRDEIYAELLAALLFLILEDSS